MAEDKGWVLTGSLVAQRAAEVARAALKETSSPGGNTPPETETKK